MSTNHEEVYRVPNRTDAEGRVWYKGLAGMDFADSRVGWAVGSGQVLHTRDAGRTWVNHYENIANTLFSPRRVCAINRSVCWIIDPIGDGPIRCLQTMDRGRSWRPGKLEPLAHPKDIFFINHKRGWLISDDGKILSGGGRIHLTDDAGESWQSEKLRLKGRPEIIRFFNSRQGWLVESVITKDQVKTVGRVHRSDDGGKNWELITTFERRILDLVVRDTQRIFICGEGGLLAGTWDGGKSWQRIKTRTRAAINSITFNSNSKGIAGGDFGTLLLSEDEGRSWHKLKSPSGNSNCVSVRMLSQDHVVIASENSLHALFLCASGHDEFRIIKTG